MWQIRRDRLIKGLQLLDLIPEKVGLSSSEFFWIRGRGDKVTFAVASYIMGEVQVIGHGEWPVKGDYFIDRRVFLPFVYASKEIKNRHTFKFTAKKDQLIVRHGSRKAVFISQKDVQGYGNLKSILRKESTTIPISQDLKALLLCGRKCAIADDIVPHLNCVFVSKLTKSVEAYAVSDRIFFLGTGAIKEKGLKSSIPFPLFLIDLLTDPTLKEVSWRGKYILFKFKRGLIWQSISTEALKKFPIDEIRNHAIEAEQIRPLFTTSSRRLSKLMMRLGYYLQAAGKRDWVVRIRGKKGTNSLLLSTNIPGVKFNERISVMKFLRKDVDIIWPLDALGPVFQFLSLKTKKLGLVVRVGKNTAVSYVTAGPYWFTITSEVKGK